MKVRVVLVRPRNPLNIGAAARAMANFGFDDLVVVKPWGPVWREVISAPHAERIVLSARTAATLEEACAGCTLVLGTTAVKDRNLDRDIVRLPDLSEYLMGRSGPIALVFGPEKTGLTNAYLEKCNACLTIPTDGATPSMNLSHSVAVCCYELARERGDAGPRSLRTPPASAEELARLSRNVLRLFETAGYLSFLPPAQKLTKIRRALYQWNIRATDVRLLHGLMRFLEGKIK
jgi:tRNA/rRNA methyltransferase